jgi:hypothetical protein
MARCKDPEDLSCQYCRHVFSTKNCLQNHHDVCVEYKLFRVKQECKTQIEQETSEYKIRLEQETREYKFRLEQESTEYKVKIEKLEDKISGLSSVISEKTIILENKDIELYKLNKKYEILCTEREKENQLQNKEYKMLVSNLVDITKNNQTLLTKPQTVTNMVYNNNQTQNNLLQFQYQLLNLNSAKLVQNIVSEIPFQNAKQLCDHAFQQGLGDSARITDYSRSKILWKDEDGSLLKDPKGKMLSKKVLSIYKPVIEKQCRISNDLHSKIYLLPATEENNRSLEYYNNYIRFSKGALNEDKDTVNEVCKHLIDSIKAKEDSSSEEDKIILSSTFVEWIQLLQKELLVDIMKWIGLTSSKFGRFIGTQVKDTILEKSTQSRFFIIQNDMKERARIYTKSFSVLLKEAIGMLFNRQNMEIFIDSMSKAYPNMDNSIIREKVEWISNDCTAEEVNKEIMNGILSI